MTVKLTKLEKTTSGWWFDFEAPEVVTEPVGVQFLEVLAEYREKKTFDCIAGEDWYAGKNWFLNDLGMKTIQHFFSNWDGFVWEEEKQASGFGPKCVGCGKIFFTVKPNLYMGQPYCNECLEKEYVKAGSPPLYTFSRDEEEELQSSEIKHTCTECRCELNGYMPGMYILEGKIYCHACWQRLQDAKVVRCADCGKVLPSIALKYTIDGKTYCGPCGERAKINARYSPFGFANGARAGCAQCGKQPETVCTHCNKPFCHRCYGIHQVNRMHEESAYTHYYRSEPFGAGETDRDILEELIRRYGRYHSFDFGPGPTANNQSSSSSSSSSTQTRYISAEAREAFKVLGLGPESTVEQIEKAYKQKAKLYHPETVAYVLEGDRYVPDHSGTIKTQEMAKLNRARDIALKHAKGK